MPAGFKVCRVDTPEYPDGIMNAQGYVEAGAWGAGFVFVGAVIAVFGTNRGKRGASRETPHVSPGSAMPR